MSQLSPVKLKHALEAAQGYLLLELPDAALRELRLYGENDGMPLTVHQLRGEALKQRGDFEEALQSFDKVLPHVEHDASLLMSMAWCFKRIGRLDQAIQAMKDAYRGSPKEPIVLYNLSCYYSLAGEKEDALSWLGRALRMDASLKKLIACESDFDSIRNDPDFQTLMRLSEPKIQTRRANE